MTLEQEVKLAAKHAYQKAYKEACEKFDKKAEKAYKKLYEKGYKEACEKFDKKAENVYKKAEIEKIMVIKKAAEEKLESARNFKESGVSLEIISKCTGLSLEEVEAL